MPTTKNSEFISLKEDGKSSADQEQIFDHAVLSATTKTWNLAPSDQKNQTLYNSMGAGRTFNANHSSIAHQPDGHTQSQISVALAVTPHDLQRPAAGTQCNISQSREDVESMYTVNQRTHYGGTGYHSDAHSMIDPRLQEPMENVYRAIMPLTGSTSRMGVTITTSKVEKGFSPRKKPLNQRSLLAASAADGGRNSHSQEDDIGRTYMNSFMNRSRYVRQSPRKVQDAENAFLKKSANLTEAGGGLRKTGSFVQGDMMQKKAKRQDGEVSLRQACQTMTYKAEITSGSTSLVQTKYQQKTQKSDRRTAALVQPQELIIPKTERGQLYTATANKEKQMNVYIGSKWYQNSLENSLNQKRVLSGEEQLSNTAVQKQQQKQILKGLKIQKEIKAMISKSQIEQKSSSFLLDTRAEQQKQIHENASQHIDNQDPKRLLLNQPSQELVQQQKANAAAIPTQEWIQVPIQHHDSSYWNLDQQANLMQNKTTNHFNAQKYASPCKTYRGNELIQSKNSAIRIAQKRGSDQRRNSSDAKNIQQELQRISPKRLSTNEVVATNQFQTTSTEAKPQEEQNQTEFQLLQEQLNQFTKEHITNVPGPHQHTAKSTTSSISPRNHQPQQSQSTQASGSKTMQQQPRKNARAVGGQQRLNKVGALHRGGHFHGEAARQKREKAASIDVNLTTQAKAITKHNKIASNIVGNIGASDQRWREYEQKSKEQLEEAVGALQIKQMVKTSAKDEGNQQVVEAGNQTSSIVLESSTTGAGAKDSNMTLGQLSHRSTSHYNQKEQRTGKTQSPFAGKHQVKVSPLRLSISKIQKGADKKESEGGQVFGIKLYIEGTPNMVSVPEISEPTLTSQAGTNTMHATDTNFNHTVKIDQMVNIQPVMGPETVCKNDFDDETYSGMRVRAELSLVEQLRVQHINSSMKMPKATKKETLMLKQEQSFSEILNTAMVPSKSIEGGIKVNPQGSGVIQSPYNSSINGPLQIVRDTQAHSPQGFMIGGSQCKSPDRIPHLPHGLTKVQSSVNSDLFNVITPKHSSRRVI